MDEVHDYRGAYAGDVAVLLTGVAIGDPGQAFEIGGAFNEAFSIVRQDKAASGGDWTFAHEIGHLQGARHDTLNDNCNSPYSNGHAYIFEDSVGDDKKLCKFFSVNLK